MMREQNHNRKSELLLQAIGELPDEMIAQAAPQNLPAYEASRCKIVASTNASRCCNGRYWCRSMPVSTSLYVSK